MAPGSSRNLSDQPNYLWIQEDGLFTDQAEAWGVADPGNHRGLVVVDLDRDGWLDMLARDINGPLITWMSRCGDASWLSVDVSQPGPNPDGVGARIEVVVDDALQTRWLVAGGTSFASSGPPVAHFGLGDVDAVDHLVVVWPDGEITRFDDVSARQAVTVYRSPPPGG